MNSYDHNVKVVLSYLSDGSCSRTTYDLSASCFRQLGEYLEEKGVGYSGDAAVKWLESCPPKSAGIVAAYKKALLRLDDVFSTGHIRYENRFGLSLAGPFSKLVSDYAANISGRYTDSHLANITNRCRFFFGLLQVERAHTSPAGIQYDDILFFRSRAKSMLSKADFCMYKGTIAGLLSWMADCKLCPPGFAMILFTNRADKVLLLGDFPPMASDALRRVGASRYTSSPPDAFLAASMGFLKELEEAGYASTVLATSKSTLELLYLFLDMNQLGYGPCIASAWLEKASAFFGTNYQMARRAIELFGDYWKTGALHPDRVFRYGPLLCDRLPGWCRSALDMFLGQKRKERMADSTVCMYRSAVTRFCAFLAGEGKTSFAQVTAEDLKKFNLTDPHATADGKNAYNVRIRRFLLFLAENGYVGNYFLREALPSASAPRAKVVRILSAQEIQTVKDAGEGTGSIKLRNHAIFLIGLRMGLRGSDITSLEFSHIDWKAQSIRFCQKKTEVGKVLPMPTEVGNALYTYLTEGRPASRSKYVFIKHKAPYGRLSRSVCRGIMARAFPSREGGRPGFHATRRTYATACFRNKCGYSQVADLLGHATTDTVHKYLSLDEENMRKCPIALESAGILMEGGLRNG